MLPPPRALPCSQLPPLREACQACVLLGPRACWGSASGLSASIEHAADIAEENAAETCRSCFAELGRVEGNWEGLPVEVRTAYLISCVTWAAAIIWRTAEDGGDEPDRASALRLIDLALLAVKADMTIEPLAIDLDPSSSGAATWMGGDEETSCRGGHTHPRQIIKAAAATPTSMGRWRWRVGARVRMRQWSPPGRSWSTEQFIPRCLEGPRGVHNL